MFLAKSKWSLMPLFLLGLLFPSALRVTPPTRTSSLLVCSPLISLWYSRPVLTRPSKPLPPHPAVMGVSGSRPEPPQPSPRSSWDQMTTAKQLWQTTTPPPTHPPPTLGMWGVCGCPLKWNKDTTTFKMEELCPLTKNQFSYQRTHHKASPVEELKRPINLVYRLLLIDDKGGTHIVSDI